MGYRFTLNIAKDDLGITQANIILNSHSKDKNGNIIVGPNCCGVTEMELFIDSLQSELETIRNEARKKLK